MRDTADRSAASARHREEGGHLRRHRPQPRSHRRHAQPAFRRLRLSTTRSRWCRSASRSRPCRCRRWIARRARSKLTTLQSPFALNGGNQTTDQKTAMSVADQMVGLLNTQAGDRYLFSGKATRSAVRGQHRRPDERRRHRARDSSRSSQSGGRPILAASGLGRLVISTPTATSVSLGEDVAGSPFGFKLAACTPTLTSAAVTGPAGAPPAIGVDFTATRRRARPSSSSFNLPDGIDRAIALTATLVRSPGPASSHRCNAGGYGCESSRRR